MPPYTKHPSFIDRSHDPYTGGPPLAELVAAPVTPTEHYFIRNHAPVPEVPRAGYRLALRDETTGGNTSELTLGQLGELPRIELVATLQCAGNRRDGLSRVREVTGETPWGAEAIGTARWGGWRLRDVLAAAGLAETRAQHVEFVGLDEIDKPQGRINFGGSIPIAKALADEVLLADAMNGEPLPPVHGFPLRAVVPGYIGARSVKWLTQVNLLAEPSSNFYQRAYSVWPPEMTRDQYDADAGRELGALPLNSAICEPADGAAVAAGKVLVRGWATTDDSALINGVELSADGGASWQPATITSSDDRWAWTQWECHLPLSAGEHTLLVRATDSSGATQPADAAPLWNFKGYANNAWHEVRVTAS